MAEISGKSDAEAATTQSEHGVEFVQVRHAARDFFDGHTELVGEFGLLIVGVRQEFVQGRIEQADGRGQSVERAEDAGEVAPLVGEKFRHGRFAAFLRVGQDHLAHRVDAVALKEHMFRAAKADALRAESHRVGDLVGLVRVGADLQAAELVRPGHELRVDAVGGALLRVERLFDQDLDDFRRERSSLRRRRLRRWCRRWKENRLYGRRDRRP